MRLSMSEECYYCSIVGLSFSFRHEALSLFDTSVPVGLSTTVDDDYDDN